VCARLTDSDVLNLRESGQRRSPVERALLVLCAAYPEMTRQQLAALSVGERDARLLEVRERTFGSELDIFTTCPGCRQELELSLSTTSLCISAPNDSQNTADGYTTLIEDLTVRYRLPDSTDLQAVTDCEDVETARSLLLDRCVVDIEGDADQREWAVDQDGKSYTPEFAAALAGQMAEREPQAEVLLNLHCAECRCQWQTLFDIATFFWAELETHGKRLLNEINILAQAYHWREQDILALTPLRRRWYLEMVTA